MPSTSPRRQLHRLRHQRGRHQPAEAARPAHRPRARRSTRLPAGTIGGARNRALGRGRLHAHLGPQPGRRLFGRSGHACRHPLDAQRNRRSRSRGQCRARAGRGRELRRRAHVRLPLSARSRPLPRPPAADRQHPRRAREPVAARLPRPQQLSASTSSASPSSIPTSAARPATASASSASTTARRFARIRSGTSAPSSTGSPPTARSIRRASPSPAAPMAAICATPRRSVTAQRLRGANCVVAISNFVTFLENTQSLSPRPEAGRIWRRARCGAARSGWSRSRR